MHLGRDDLAPPDLTPASGDLDLGVQAEVVGCCPQCHRHRARLDGERAVGAVKSEL